MAPRNRRVEGCDVLRIRVETARVLACLARPNRGSTSPLRTTLTEDTTSVWALLFGTSNGYCIPDQIVMFEAHVSRRINTYVSTLCGDSRVFYRSVTKNKQVQYPRALARNIMPV